MKILRALRPLLTLAEEVIETALFLVDFGPCAERLWNEACADRLAEREAEEEVSEPQVSYPNRFCIFCWRPGDCDCVDRFFGTSQSSSSTLVAGAGPVDDESPAPPSSPDVAGAGHSNREGLDTK